MEYVFLFLWEHQSVLFKTNGLPLISIEMWLANLSIVLFTQTATGWVVADTGASSVLCKWPFFLAPQANLGGGKVGILVLDFQFSTAHI